MIATLAVAAGGAMGSVARYWIGVWSILLLGQTFPWGTLFVNVTGSFVIGMAASLPGSDLWRQFLMVGVCGGYTTFSAFSLQTFVLARTGVSAAAAVNVLLSVAICLAAVAGGFWVGGRLAGHTLH